jgi:hypothetical protein
MRALRIAAAVAAAALGTAGPLALAGCSADVAPGAAALDADGDVVVTVDEVETVSAELTEAFPGTPEVDRLVVFFSVIADDVRDAARESGTPVSADEARRGVAEQTEVQLSAEAAEVIAVSTMFAQLAQGPQGEALLERVSGLEPVVNPRYGVWDPATWDPGQGVPISDETLPWLAEAEGEPTG